MNPQYLGDGVYIQYDHISKQFAITTGSHKYEDSDAIIYLEHEVAKPLIRYIQYALKEHEPTI